MTDLEIMQHAKSYMDKLAKGIDPISNHEIPEDSTLNQARLSKCFQYVSDILQQVIDNGGITHARQKKTDLILSPQVLSRIKPAEHSLRITEFVEMLSTALDDPNMKRPKTTAITDWLLEKGFLEKVSVSEGKQQRFPTELGRKIGLYTENRQGPYGEYTTVYYSVEAQQFLLDHLKDIFPQG